VLVAITMNPHDADPAFAIFVLDERHLRASSSAGYIARVSFHPGPAQ